MGTSGTPTGPFITPFHARLGRTQNYQIDSFSVPIFCVISHIKSTLKLQFITMLGTYDHN